MKPLSIIYRPHYFRRNDPKSFGESPKKNYLHKGPIHYKGLSIDWQTQGPSMPLPLGFHHLNSVYGVSGARGSKSGYAA